MVLEKMLKIEYIESTTIPDAWFQCISSVFEKGRKYIIDQGSFEGETRLEFDFITIYIKYPYSEPWDTMLPQIPASLGIPNPVKNEYIEEYMPYLMTNYISENEIYTYGSRICNQVDYFIKRMKRDGFNSNQYILQVARPADAWLSDPCCMRHIDMKVIENKLVFYPYYRSWDLWSGTPANLAALAVLQKYIADELNIESGELIATSKGLHLYSFVEQLAKLRCGK